MVLDLLANLFSNIDALSLVLIAVGLLFCIVEMLMAVTFFFGIAGIACVVIGFVMYVVKGGGLVDVIIMLLITLAVLWLAFILVAHSAKKGWISRSPLVLKKTALPEEYLQNAENELYDLVGEIGVSASKINPYGCAVFNGKEYEVYSASVSIDKGKKIKISKIDEMKIIVEIIEEEEEKNDDE